MQLSLIHDQSPSSSLTWICSDKAPTHPLTHWAFSLSVFIACKLYWFYSLCPCLVVHLVCQYIMCKIVYLFIQVFPVFTEYNGIASVPILRGAVSLFWRWYSEVSHCSMLPTVPTTVLITPTPQTLQPRAQNLGKSLQSPGRSTMEGMPNMSQHLSHSNLPTSGQSHWLEGLAGMGKRTDGLLNRVHGKTWSNLHSYEIGVCS